MSHEFNPANNGQTSEPAAAGADAHERLDELIGQIAAGLYSVASMLLGEGEESVRLVETAVAAAEVSVCCDPAKARQSSLLALGAAALSLLAERDPDSLAAPEGLEPATTCIEDDDLALAGVSSDALKKMIGRSADGCGVGWQACRWRCARFLCCARWVASPPRRWPRCCVSTAGRKPPHGARS